MLLLLGMGVLSVFYQEALLEKTLLGRLVAGGLAIFWLLRLLIQLFGYDRRLWIGNRFNTSMHVLFTLMWGYYVLVFGSLWWHQRLLAVA